MYTQDLFVDECRETKAIEAFYTMSPSRCISIFSQTLIIKAIDLCNLATLMAIMKDLRKQRQVTSEQCRILNAPHGCLVIRWHDQDTWALSRATSLVFRRYYVLDRRSLRGKCTTSLAANHQHWEAAASQRIVHASLQRPRMMEITIMRVN
jgi:hypothetical protein